MDFKRISHFVDDASDRVLNVARDNVSRRFATIELITEDLIYNSIRRPHRDLRTDCINCRRVNDRLKCVRHLKSLFLLAAVVQRRSLFLFAGQERLNRPSRLGQLLRHRTSRVPANRRQQRACLP